MASICVSGGSAVIQSSVRGNQNVIMLRYVANVQRKISCNRPSFAAFATHERCGHVPKNVDRKQGLDAPPHVPSHRGSFRLPSFNPRTTFSSISSTTVGEKMEHHGDKHNEKESKDEARNTPRLSVDVSNDKEAFPFNSNENFDEFEFSPATVVEDIKQASKWVDAEFWDPESSRDAFGRYVLHLRYALHHTDNNKRRANCSDNVSEKDIDVLISPEVATLAIKTLLRTKTHTSDLSVAVRRFERLLGSFRTIPMTQDLSYNLLVANGKAGNVGRTLSILEARERHPPQRLEFHMAVQSILSAGLDLRRFRNVYAKTHDDVQSPIDDPTRWLDAVLVNMFERGVALDVSTANKMLNCFASTGRSGKAAYWFYQVRSDGRTNNDNGDPPRVRMRWNSPPEHHKVPTLSKERSGDKSKHNKRLESELNRDYSVPLTAAFAFADSLTHGACGHDPIELNVISYNTLIKVCCYRGAIWRAIHILNDVMPRKGIAPDTISYNSVMHALARVGDRSYLKEMLTSMTNKSVPVDEVTVQALVDGFLNASDIAGAITMVQDMFNQHSILPPYTSHLKILEFSLSNEMAYEAKRHVYFLQQLWDMNEERSKKIRSMSERQKETFMMTANSPKLNKKALIKLFRYYGEDLKDEDFGLKATSLKSGKNWHSFFI